MVRGHVTQDGGSERGGRRGQKATRMRTARGSSRSPPARAIFPSVRVLSLTSAAPPLLSSVLAVGSDSTSSRVIWFSVLSMIVLLALNGGQVLYLKQYFQAKKLIQ